MALSLVGRHNVTNALAALAAASVWGIGAREAAEVLPRMKPARCAAKFYISRRIHRHQRLLQLESAAMASMMDLLANTPGYRRRILAAGEMLELGAASSELHSEAGRYAASKKLDWIIGVRGACRGVCARGD